MTEKEFANYIDCNISYTNFDKLVDLLNQAKEIGHNCVFILLEEVLRPPFSASAEKGVQKKFLEYVKNNYHHNLLNDILDIGVKIIEGLDVEERDAVNILNKLCEHKGLYSALNIVYFGTDDKSGNIDVLYNKIILEWNN